MKEGIDEKNKKEFNMNRRTFVKIAGATIGAAALGLRLPLAQIADAAFPLTKFVDPLPIPPVAIPNKVKYPGADYYEIPIVQATTHKFHRDLPPTTTYSYGADYLGPTIVAQKNRMVRMKFTNNLPRGNHLLHDAIDTTIMGASPDDNAVMNWKPGDDLPPNWVDENRVAVHLHGGKVRPEFDGHPRAWFSPVGSNQVNPYPEAVGNNGSYEYQYPNDQPAAGLWYHDHAFGITRFNPSAGLAAGYLLRDPLENVLIRTRILPSGKYEVPIVLQDKVLDPDTGAMLYPIEPDAVTAFHPKWIPEYFGDTPIVNGKAYPYLNVDRTRYRFRFFNGSNAAFYNVSFETGTGPVPFYVIGSDQGFLPLPVQLNKLLIAPGERFDIIFNFERVPLGTVLTLKNDANTPYPDGDQGITEIMQFNVNSGKANNRDNAIGAIDNMLKSVAVPTPQIATPAKPWREIVLRENEDPVSGNPIEVLLDSRPFMDSLNDPTLFAEKAGKPNVWQFVNLTVDAHPMHLHLVKFKVLNRQPFDVDGFKPVWDAWVAGGRVGPRPTVDNYLTKGPAIVPPQEERGFKDTAKAYPGQILRILATFDLPSGLKSGKYVSHCHILEHEENDMMLQFMVS